MHSGNLPSILASGLAEEGQSEQFLRGVSSLLPRMDGGETWRCASMDGASATYLGLAPSMLANMAGWNPHVFRGKAESE
jgi:hypothetical protein